jgi:hypothetical protein
MPFKQSLSSNSDLVLSHFWQIQIQQDVDEHTTHVIAARTGTAKVFKASRVNGCAIVNAAWLMSCYWSISLRDVSCFLLVPIRLKETDLRPPPSRVAAAPPAKLAQTNNILLVGDDEEDEDKASDDDDEDEALLEKAFMKS